MELELEGCGGGRRGFRTRGYYLVFKFKSVIHTPRVEPRGHINIKPCSDRELLVDYY